MEDGAEADAELPVEEGVKDGVDAGVGSSQPLRERKQVVYEGFVHPWIDRTSQLNSGEDDVQWQPGAGEQHDDYQQHFDDLDFGPVYEVLAVALWLTR